MKRSKRSKGSGKISFQMRVTLVFAFTVAFAVLVCWMASRLFLERYNERYQIRSLEKTYRDMSRILSDSKSSEMEIQNYLNQVTGPNRISCMIAIENTDGMIEYLWSTEFDDIPGSFKKKPENPTNTLKPENNNTHEGDSEKTETEGASDRPTTDEEMSTNTEGSKMDPDERDHLLQEFNKDPGQSEIPGFQWGSEKRFMFRTFRDYYVDCRTGLFRDYTNGLVEKNDRYRVWMTTDAYTSYDNIDLVGKVDEGVYMMLRASRRNLAVAADSAATFLQFVGVVVVLLGGFVVFLLSRVISRPITHMTEAADQMAHLNFDVHCPQSGTEEFDSLANSLNHLSKKLETTIGELKESNNQLQKDIEHKVEIDNMRTEFLSNVSHELKTPIALIQGYAEGLSENLEEEDAETRKYYCEVIMDEARKMNTMVQKLLTLNQIECGQQMLEMARFDLVPLLKGVIDSFEVLGKDKKVTMHFHERGPVYVWADEYLIEQVVTNYISNAYNHVGRSNEIAVSLEQKDGLVRCSVYNTGDPIPEADRSKVWDKFYKVDKARTREYGGSGIGLSIVKAIMDNHNRAYGVNNHSGGVEFWFELELAQEEPKEE